MNSDKNNQNKPVHKKHNEEEKKRKIQIQTNLLQLGEHYHQVWEVFHSFLKVPERQFPGCHRLAPCNSFLVYKVHKEIGDTYKKKDDVVRESHNKNYTLAKILLINLFKIKQEQRKKVNSEFEASLTSKDMYKKQLDEISERGNDYCFKMKIPAKRVTSKQSLSTKQNKKKLKNRQSKGDFTLQEEKRLLKEISDLEKSFPYVGPIERLQELSKEAIQEANQKYELLRLERRSGRHPI